MTNAFADPLLTAQQIDALRIRHAGGLTFRVLPDAIANNPTTLAAIANLYGQLGPYLAAWQQPDHLQTRMTQMLVNGELRAFVADVLWIFIRHTGALIARLEGADNALPRSISRKSVGRSAAEDYAWTALSYQSMIGVNVLCAPFFAAFSAAVSLPRMLGQRGDALGLLRMTRDSLQQIANAIPV